VVVDCEEIILVDDTGADALRSYLGYAQKYGVGLMLARVNSGTHKRLELAGFVDELGEERIFDTVRNAVDAAVAKNG
jgi:anti-anti-sigma regulatory factor